MSDPGHDAGMGGPRADGDHARDRAGTPVDPVAAGGGRGLSDDAPDRIARRRNAGIGGDERARDRIDRIEAAIHQDVGRGMAPVFAATRGGLFGAVSALAAAPPRSVGLLTGFYVPGASPPAAETDGPAGAALLAVAFSRLGVACRVLTDEACRAACEAALRGAGVPEVPVDAVAPNAPLAPIVEAWRSHGIDWAIAIERCGPGADGRPRNMRGHDVGAHTAPLHEVFSAGPWHTLAIGDGGNEIGMGSLPPGLVAQTVAFGGQIACAIPADRLIAAGVSHWGAYALIAALAVALARPGLLDCLEPALDAAVLEALVRDGPAVDGVTLRRALTIDGLDLEAHGAVRDRVRRFFEGGWRERFPPEPNDKGREDNP